MTTPGGRRRPWDLIASAAVTAVLLAIAVPVAIARTGDDPVPAYCTEGIPASVDVFEGRQKREARLMLEGFDEVTNLTYIDDEEIAEEYRERYAGSLPDHMLEDHANGSVSNEYRFSIADDATHILVAVEYRIGEVRTGAEVASCRDD